MKQKIALLGGELSKNKLVAGLMTGAILPAVIGAAKILAASQ